MDKLRGNVNIINHLYPINGRMCTLEDLFVEYNQLNLLNNAYRLLEPDKDLCPSVQDIYDDNVKVYYIEEKIYQELLKEDSSIYFYDFTKGSLIDISPITDNNNPIIGYNTARPSGIFGDGTNSSTNQSSTRPSEILYQQTYTGSYDVKNSKHANYWAIYMKEDLFNQYILNRMVQYFNSTEITENDAPDVLFNILATKIYHETQEKGKAVYLAEVTQFNNIWTTVAEILVDFFYDVFSNMKYKNEYVFYSNNTKSTGIKAFNIMAEYWKKISPDYNPDQTKCRFEFTIASDLYGYYIKAYTPVEVKKYLCREITDVDALGNKTTYLRYIRLVDIEDMCAQLLHWIQKNFIYLPYHIPNIGVNTNGSQMISYMRGLNGDKNSGYSINWATSSGNYLTMNTELSKKDNIDWPGIYENYKKKKNNCLVRMCDIQPGYFVINDEDNEQPGTTDGSTTTSKSNKAFKFDQCNSATNVLMQYALQPQNYETINAEYELKYYSYLCTIDIGNNDVDSLTITPDPSVAYNMQETYSTGANGNPKKMYNIAMVPKYENKTAKIITYTSTIKQSLSNISTTIVFRHYPTQFLVYPVLQPLSSRYHYEIEKFSINSANVNSRCLEIVKTSDIGVNDSVIYQYQFAKVLNISGDNCTIELKGTGVRKENVRLDELKIDNDMHNNIYYLIQNMTETSDLSSDLTMSITISVFLSSEYEAWKRDGMFKDSTNTTQYQLLPMEDYDSVDNDNSCNIQIEFYEINNYETLDINLLNNNKNSVHKYLAGRTDMVMDNAFNTMKFSTTIQQTKTVAKCFTTSYASWLDGKRVVLNIYQFIPSMIDTTATEAPEEDEDD